MRGPAALSKKKVVTISPIIFIDVKFKNQFILFPPLQFEVPEPYGFHAQIVVVQGQHDGL